MATTAPWCVAGPCLATLRRQVAIEERARESHLQSACGALVVVLPVESSVEHQRRTRVALDLLHTLWVLDRAAWRQAMEQAVGVPVPASLVVPPEEDRTPLTVVISVKHDKFPWQLNRERWAPLLEPDVQLTAEEEAITRELIRTYHDEDKVQELQSAIPLRLQFLVFGMATSQVQLYVTRAVDMVEAVRDHLAKPTADVVRANSCAPFVLESLELNVSPYEMTSDIARQIMRLHGLGIRFHQLNMRIMQEDIDTDQQQETADRDRLTRVLLAPAEGEASVVSSAGPIFPIETLSIDRADLVQFTAACEAIATTQRLKNLQLQNVFTFDSPIERTLKWEWLTRAVFSPSSRTGIKHLSINQTEIELTDVDTVTMSLHLIAAQEPDRHHALETLAIGSEASDADTIEAIPLLLDQIGHNLDALSIYLWMGSLTMRSIVRIHNACQQLQFLDLSSVEIESMDVFLNAYEHGSCKIRALALHNVEVPNASVTAFATALCDQRHRASCVLRELCIDCVGEDNMLDQTNVDAFYHLLQAKGSPLEYLELRVHEPLLTQNRSRFVSHHNTWGSGVAAPLSIAAKAAFLSACRSRGGRNDPCEHGKHPTESHVASQMSKLDPLIISLIFKLAATCSWRNVYIAEP